MLQPVMHVLKQKNIILASGSPRRKELIENIVSKKVPLLNYYELLLNIYSNNYNVHVFRG